MYVKKTLDYLVQLINNHSNKNCSKPIIRKEPEIEKRLSISSYYGLFIIVIEKFTNVTLKMNSLTTDL